MKRRDISFLKDVIVGGSAIVVVLSITSYLLFRAFSGHGFLAVCFLIALLGFFVFRKAVKVIGSAIARVVTDPFERLLSFKKREVKPPEKLEP